MSVSRRHVFVEKVLKRLFPNVPSDQEKETPQLLPLETPFRKTTSEKVEHRHIHHLTDGDVKIQPERRLYTVSLPPEGYVPCLPEPSSRTDSESASSGTDAEVAVSSKENMRTKAGKENVRVSLLFKEVLPVVDFILNFQNQLISWMVTS